MHDNQSSLRAAAARPPTGPNPAGDRIGELLARAVPLSRHDVYEILAEQAGTGKRFGQIALQWGLCEPAHVWRAWASQLAGRAPRVDLSAVGVDARAAADVPPWLAASLHLVPIRSADDGLVVATTEASLARAAELLTPKVDRPVTFVLADADQIEAAVQRYYATVAKPTPRACAGMRCGSKCRGDACPSRAKRPDRLTEAAVA